YCVCTSCFFFSSRRRHTRWPRDWSSDVCSSDLGTDGIRGIAGKPPLDRDTVYRVGYCLTEYLRHLAPSPHILIGRDTRESGPWRSEERRVGKESRARWARCR